jgi:hypothetical protein
MVAGCFMYEEGQVIEKMHFVTFPLLDPYIFFVGSAEFGQGVI